eukprot:s5366_g1.t1
MALSLFSQGVGTKFMPADAVKADQGHERVRDSHAEARTVEDGSRWRLQSVGSRIEGLRDPEGATILWKAKVANSICDWPRSTVPERCQRRWLCPNHSMSAATGSSSRNLEIMGCSPFKEAAEPAKPREIVSESGTSSGYTYTVTSAYPGPTLLQKASAEDGGKMSPLRSRGDKPKSPEKVTHQKAPEEPEAEEDSGEEVLMHISL